MTGERGHRVEAHTADVILEAWGPDLAACCEEAVAALVSTFADASGATVVERRRVGVAAGEPSSMLVTVLEEVIFTLDTSDGVPVAAQVQARHGGGLDVELVLADRDQVEATGSAPKAVARSELAVDTRPGRVSCRFLVDV